VIHELRTPDTLRLKTGGTMEHDWQTKMDG
jgi:hypothetical protein